MRSPRLLSALALSGLLACSKPPAQESRAAPPATSATTAPEATTAGDEGGAAGPPAGPDPDVQLLAEAAQIAAQAKAENEEDAKDRERQRQTVADVRSLGV